MVLEICACSFKSAKAAVLGGADRIELCEDLSIGGITPAPALIKYAAQDLKIEAHVLIRPRGGDFCYNPLELKQMIHDIELAKKAGAKGVVFGALTINNSLDLNALNLLIEASQGIAYSFHKAFDELENPEAAIDLLTQMGFTRILTSGCKPTALEGLASLNSWNKTYDNKIEIMPGGGIRPENISNFLGHKFKSIHSAAIPNGHAETDLNTVAALRQSVNANAD